MQKDSSSHGRVRSATSEDNNLHDDERILRNINKFKDYNKEAITRRLRKLYNEWDMERLIEVNASALALAGLVLRKYTQRRWGLLTTVVAGFLLQHGVKGWIAPLPIFRKLGIRTRTEINEEIYALKILRGDFDSISGSSEPMEILRSLRRT